MWKEAVVCFKVLSFRMPGGNDEDHIKIQSG
jgi:hypothetical protein